MLANTICLYVYIHACQPDDNMSDSKHVITAFGFVQTVLNINFRSLVPVKMYYYV